MENDYTNTSDVLKRLKALYPNELPKELIGDLQLSHRQGIQRVIREIECMLFTQEAKEIQQGK